MQLEIKTIINFGEDGPPTEDMNDILRFVTEKTDLYVHTPLINTYGASFITHTGWTSSGDDEEEEEQQQEDTYCVKRFYQDPGKATEIIKTGLTRAEAIEHCEDADSSGFGWFDGFDKE